MNEKQTKTPFEMKIEEVINKRNQVVDELAKAIPSTPGEHIHQKAMLEINNEDFKAIVKGATIEEVFRENGTVYLSLVKNGITTVAVFTHLKGIVNNILNEQCENESLYIDALKEALEVEGK